MFKNEVLVSNSHINNKLLMKDYALLNVLQDIEGIHIENLTTFNNYLNANNLGVFLLYRQVEIIRRPKFGEKIIVATYPYNTRAIGGYRHIYIINEKGEKIVKTDAFGAFVDLETYKPRRITKEVVESFKDGLKDESILPYKRKIEYNNENEIFLGKRKILKSNIDRYDHVNNAYYLDFALDAIDYEIDYNLMRLEYLKSYRINDTVLVYLIREENKHVFVLKSENFEINAVIELSMQQLK